MRFSTGNGHALTGLIGLILILGVTVSGGKSSALKGALLILGALLIVIAVVHWFLTRNNA